VCSSDLPLCAMRGGALAGTLENHEIHFGPGDLALQFTDGLNEAWNPDLQEQFDFDRIAEHLVKTGPEGGQALMEKLLPAVEEWSNPDSLEDDFTLLTIGRAAAPVEVDNDNKNSSPARIGGVTSNEQLQEMMGGHSRLHLASRFDDLGRIDNWLATCRTEEGSLADHQDLVQASLFEVCGNIIEHGYSGRDSHSIDIWWVPIWGDDQLPADFTEAVDEDDSPLDGVGYFVICDEGKEYDHSEWTPPDLNDRATRRRGRGLGWQIIYSAMNQVVLLPKTPAGNLTLLLFDPAKITI